MGQSGFVAAGIDFGGTNIKVGFVTRKGHVVDSLVVPTAECPSPEAFVRRMRQSIDTLRVRTRIPARRVRGVGIGAPGLIDMRRGVIHRLVNVPGHWAGVPLAKLLSARIHRPCVMDNDVNVVALGEWRFGAGRGTRESLYVTLGTGVGGGLVVNGGLVRGVSGSAGEIGHLCLDAKGPPCACGGRGCLEALIGTAAILQRARASMRRGHSPVLARLMRKVTGTLTPALISRAARSGDRGAVRLWRDVGSLLGIGLASAVNLLNPERVVIGGGIANAWRWFAPSLRAALRARAFALPGAAVRIVRARLGARAGIVGGAVLVWEERGA